MPESGETVLPDGRLTAGLIGAHIQKTRLPRALEIMCEDAGIAFDFSLIDTADQPGFDFASTVSGLISRGWTGVTVTHPFKTQAAAFADAGMAPDLRRMGAANTLIFGPALRARNTDHSGFLGAWHARMGGTLPGAVAMAGAGGVARALAFALRDLGASDIAIWDIEPARAAQLARDAGGPARAIPAAQTDAAVLAADGLVNATALGMEHSPGMAFAPATIGGQSWAFDAVYTPASTEFLQAAGAAGLKCLSGFDLFRHMAIGSFTAYTGIAPDRDATLEKLQALAPG